MPAKVGIPRTLAYYKYHPLWRTFFGELGAEVVVSPESNRGTVTRGVALAENELCLPVKLAFGHAASLVGECDVLFVPRVVSVEGGAYTCPKFLGLPDMLRAADLELPPILAPTINLRTSRHSFKRAMAEAGDFLGAGPREIRSAFSHGMAQLERYERLMRSGLTPVDIEDGIEDPAELVAAHDAAHTEPAGGDGVTIGIVGHPYNLYDRHVSMNLVRRLRSHGVHVRSPEMLSPSDVADEASRLPKELFWTYEKEVVGAAFHWANSGSVDGIIYMLSFACGPDSIVQVLVEHEIRRNTTMPMMSLVVDEHSAEAGLVTRLEAFLDMLRWRKGQAA
jgi:predicted nucleotide-binding protein (sugar kinase/HSP70/actin superfamily)